MPVDLLPDITLPEEDNIKEEITEDYTEPKEPKVRFVDEVEQDNVEQTDIPIEPKHVEEEEEIFKEEKPKRKPRPRKGELTEKQAEHLKKAREKGLAVRRKKAAERKAAKEEEEQIKLEVSERREKEKLIKKHKVDIPINKVYQLDEAMIQKLKEDAIEGYDQKRKARKKKKQEEQKANQVEAKTFDVITKAVNATNPDDIYASCFGFQ